jgi:3-dehydroquinate dehydratase
MSKVSNDQRLASILGFDPTSPAQGAGDALAAAVAEVKAERRAENLVKAKELVKKAMELRVKQDKLKKEFQAADAKFEKELGALLNTIQKMGDGGEADTQEESAQ